MEQQKKKRRLEEFIKLCEIVEKEYGISKRELSSKSRIRPIVELRGICSNIILSQKKGYSLSEVGKCFNVDHATISHYKKIHLSLYENPSGKQYTTKFDYLKNEYEKNSYISVKLSQVLKLKKFIDEILNNETLFNQKINPNKKIILDNEKLSKYRFY